MIIIENEISEYADIATNLFSISVILFTHSKF